jgi:putative tryptophan/tyrosine transport system substrate-binding protein
MRRREFIAGIGAALALPSLAARAQQTQRMRRIGVFMSAPPEDIRTQAFTAALLQGLQELGWTVGRNVQLEWRWYAANETRARKDAEELVARAPDVIITISGPALRAVLQTGSTVPIVFANVVDPLGNGFISSLARPGGNVTGFASVDHAIAPKWLELLKEITPRVTRALVFRTASIGGGAQFGAIQAVSPGMGVELRPVDPSNLGEIERAVTELAREPNGGLIVTASNPAWINREAIITLAARYRLPAVFSKSDFVVVGGGLVSYGPVDGDVIRRAIGYVDRILKGEKPGDLPVQAPTRYETVLNLKTAKALGLDVPVSLLTRADEVIE